MSVEVLFCSDLKEQNRPFDKIAFISLHSGLCLWRWRRPSRDARTVVRVGGVRAALRRWRWREYSQDIRETNVSSQSNSDTHSMVQMNGERLFVVAKECFVLYHWTRLPLTFVQCGLCYVSNE